jgi:hypothetical protein
MERAHPETIKVVVKAGQDFGVKVMGDNLAAADMVAAAKRLEDLGCDYVIHHIGYDQRRGIGSFTTASWRRSRAEARSCGGSDARAQLADHGITLQVLKMRRYQCSGQAYCGHEQQD